MTSNFCRRCEAVKAIFSDPQQPSIANRGTTEAAKSVKLVSRRHQELPDSHSLDVFSWYRHTCVRTSSMWLHRGIDQIGTEFTGFSLSLVSAAHMEGRENDCTCLFALPLHGSKSPRFYLDVDASDDNAFLVLLS